MTADERVTLLSGGNAVYLYAPGDPNISAMEGVLNVAYPAEEVLRRTVPVATWEAARQKLVAEGIEVIDVRESGEAAT